MTAADRPTDADDVARAEGIVMAAIAASPLCLRSIVRHRITSEGDVTVSLVCLVPRALIVATRPADREDIDPRTRTSDDAAPAGQEAHARAARMRVDSLVREIRGELAGLAEHHRAALIDRAVELLRGAP
jgi:hypothetical protein